MSDLVISGAPETVLPAYASYGRFMFDNLISGGSKIALIDGETGSSCTYEELLQRSVNLASGLRRLGVKRGDIVGICSENRTEYAVTVIAIIFCGGVVATASPAYTTYEMNHVLKLSKPKYMFCSQKALDAHFDIFKNVTKEIIVFSKDIPKGKVNTLLELSNQYTEVNTFNPTEIDDINDDVVAILCSSGTTGLQKGVMLTHLNFIRATMDFVEQQGSPQLKNMISFVPWHHTYGFSTTLHALNAQKTIVYLSRFEDKLFLKTIQEYKINFVLAVPTVVVIIAKSTLLENFDVSSVKKIVSGAGPIDADTILRVKKRIPTLSEMTSTYGMTESGCVMRDQTLDTSNAGSAGKLVRGIKAKIVDLKTGKALGPNEKGEVCIKGSLIMKGYIGDAAATENSFDEDGFFRTGDIGYYTKNEIFFIVDRVKELIKYKGNQVPPAEVEGVLMQYEGVQECAVVGKPDELAGELPTAFVVKAQGSRVSEKDLTDWVAAKLSNPKRLRGGVRFVEALPRNPSGKVLRRVLKKKYFGKPVSKL